MLAPGARSDFVAAETLNGVGTEFGRHDTSIVADVAADLAALPGTFLRCHTAAAVFRVHREATAVADAEAIFREHATHNYVLAVKAIVHTHAGVADTAFRHLREQIRNRKSEYLRKENQELHEVVDH